MAITKQTLLAALRRFKEEADATYTTQIAAQAFEISSTEPKDKSKIWVQIVTNNNS